MPGCPRHGVALTKNRGFDGEIFYACPKDKCGYTENVEGEKKK